MSRSLLFIYAFLLLLFEQEELWTAIETEFFHTSGHIRIALADTESFHRLDFAQINDHLVGMFGLFALPL